jgi:hypothetical protein
VAKLKHVGRALGVHAHVARGIRERRTNTGDPRQVQNVGNSAGLGEGSLELAIVAHVRGDDPHAVAELALEIALILPLRLDRVRRGAEIVDDHDPFARATRKELLGHMITDEADASGYDTRFRAGRHSGKPTLCHTRRGG